MPNLATGPRRATPFPDLLPGYYILLRQGLQVPAAARSPRQQFVDKCTRSQVKSGHKTYWPTKTDPLK